MLATICGNQANVAMMRHRHEQALALAELGLERTRAYLAQVAATDVDLDRALDPRLDTTCAVGATVTFTVAPCSGILVSPA